MGGFVETTNVARQRSRFVTRLLAGLLVVGFANAASAIAAFAGSAIVTQAGPVKGVQMFGVDAFLGIPYAAPPVGALRWTPPTPHAHFKGVFNANQFGSMCTQPGGALSGGSGEDCLTLNVFTPHLRKNRKKKPLPVMFWIHGGGLTTGGSIIFDPSPLILKGNVIVVTINYRLGLLGFFAHPAIDAANIIATNVIRWLCIPLHVCIG